MGFIDQIMGAMGMEAAQTVTEEPTSNADPQRTEETKTDEEKEKAEKIKTELETEFNISVLTIQGD